MSGASNGASSGACLGHVWDNIWGILSTMDNNGQQSAVLHASVMPFFNDVLIPTLAGLKPGNLPPR